MFYTDTHAHLHSKELRNDADSIIKRAFDLNIKRIITVGTKLDDSKNAVALAAKYKGIYATVGVHPHYAEAFDLKSLGQMENLLSDKKVIAVGEVGLDYYRNLSAADKQKEVFRLMIDMSIGSNLPLIIHARNAADDIVKVLNEMLGDNDHKVLFHCFSGEQILIDWGMKRKNVRFSFAGNVTYPKAVELHTALEQIPKERLFIETDCPYLTPVPFRGKQNEPAYIVHTANYIAGSKKIPLDEMLKQYEENFQSFFGVQDSLNL